MKEFNKEGDRELNSDTTLIINPSFVFVVNDEQLATKIKEEITSYYIKKTVSEELLKKDGEDTPPKPPKP